MPGSREKIIDCCASGILRETMTWSCPYEIDGDCKRLKKACKPLSKGCVLDKKVKFIGEENKDTEKTTRDEKG